MTLEVRIALSEEYSQIDELLPSTFSTNVKIVISAHRNDQFVGAGWLEALPRAQARDYLRLNLATSLESTERENVRDALLHRLCVIAKDWGAGGVVLGGRRPSEGPDADQLRLSGFQPSRTIETFTIDLDHLSKALDASAIHTNSDWESRQPRKEDFSSIRTLFSQMGRRAIKQCTRILKVPELSRVLVEGEPGSPREITGVLSVYSNPRFHRPISSWRNLDQSVEKARFLLVDALPSWRSHGIDSLEFRRFTSEDHAPLLEVACDAGADCSKRESFWIKSVEDFQSNG